MFLVRIHLQDHVCHSKMLVLFSLCVLGLLFSWAPGTLWFHHLIRFEIRIWVIDCHVRLWRV